MAESDSRYDELLDHYILCPRCNTLYRKTDLGKGQYAQCKECTTILYRYDPHHLNRALMLAVTGIILFIMANSFPLVRIDFLGKEQYVNTLAAVYQLVQSGYYLVALGVLFMVVVIPALVLLDFILLLTLMQKKRGEKIVKRLLILLAHLLPWSMADIFLISVLVALVKLSDDVGIWFGVSFWAMILYVGIDLYLTKVRRQGDLWEQYMRIYHAQK